MQCDGVGSMVMTKKVRSLPDNTVYGMIRLIDHARTELHVVVEWNLMID